MRLVVIDAHAKTYTLYEGRKLVGEWKSDVLLDAEYVELIRLTGRAA